MVWCLVCRLFSQTIWKNQRTERFLFFVGTTIVLFFSMAFAQQDTSSMKPAPIGLAVDSLAAHFEDIYGRLPDATLSSLSYSYYEESLEISSRYDGLVDHFNSGEARFMVGNRGSYEMIGGLRNSWLNDQDQFYNMVVTLRPVNSWEFSGNTSYERYENGNTTKNASFNLSGTYLSDGQLQFTESGLMQYYFFSDLLLNPDQSEFFFSPGCHTQLINVEPSGKNHQMGLPVSFSYGLSSRLTIGLDGYFYDASGKSSYVFSNGITSFEVSSWEAKFGLNVSYLFNDDNLFKFGIGWYNNGADGTLSDSLSGDEFLQITPIKNSHSFAVLSASWNTVSLRRSISIYDLRRIPYTSTYLEQGEAINQARIEYLTDDYSAIFEESSIGWTKKILLSDSLAAGTFDFLQFELAGSLGVPLREGDFWRGRLIGGFTFHNLRFAGTELNDFDYFFGKINSPGDYSAATNVVVSSMEWTQYPGEPDLQFNFIGRIGTIRGLDAGLDFVYKTWKYSGGSSPYENWMWGGSIRGNILDRLRLQCSLSWKKDVDYAGGPWFDWNSVTAEVSLNALF